MPFDPSTEPPSSELSAGELFEFVRALPAREAVAGNAAAAFAAFESWVSTRSDSTAYPVAEA